MGMIKKHRILGMMVAAIAIAGLLMARSSCDVRAAETDDLTTTQKNSSYGFFVWLSENAASEQDRNDAEAAAQLLTNSVSSTNRSQVFNDGSIFAGSSVQISFADLLSYTSLGAENDATSLDNLRDAIEFVKLSNTYRAKENLAPLKIASALMAMSEINANYVPNSFNHTCAFFALENLAYRQLGGTWQYGSFPGASDDPFEGWYTEEKEYFDAGEETKAGHYKTLTDRQGVMAITGFGVCHDFAGQTLTASDGKDYLCMMDNKYYSQHFSDGNRMYSITDGMTPEQYLAYLNRYESEITGGERESISTAIVEGIKDKTYTGKAITQTLTITVGGAVLNADTDYSVEYKNNIKAGTATLEITGKGNYEGTIVRTFTIKKAANPLKASGKTATVKYSRVKKKAQVIAKTKVLAVSKNQGTVTYVKASGNKKITINKSTGKVTVKKGLKKGTYKVKIKVTAAGNSNYNKLTKTVTCKVRVR